MGGDAYGKEYMFWEEGEVWAACDGVSIGHTRRHYMCDEVWHDIW